MKEDNSLETKVREEMTNEERFQKELETDTFHIRMLKYIYLTVDEQEIIKLGDDFVLYMELQYGTYEISWKELREKADAETLRFIEKHNIELKPQNDNEGDIE